MVDSNQGGESLLFLTDEQLRKGIEAMFFAYRGFTADPDRILETMDYGRAHHRAIRRGHVSADFSGHLGNPRAATFKARRSLHEWPLLGGCYRRSQSSDGRSSACVRLRAKHFASSSEKTTPLAIPPMA